MAHMADTGASGLEDVAGHIRDEVDARGPFPSADAAVARLRARVPHIQRLLVRLDYPHLVAVQKGAYQALKARGAPPSLVTEVNKSYDLAAKVAASVGGYHSARMHAQQREQLHTLGAIVEREIERQGIVDKLPGRFHHRMRHCALLLGLHEFLHLHPLPTPLGGSILCKLEDIVRRVFEALGWEWHPLQEPFEPTPQQLASGELVPPHYNAIATKRGKQWWRAVPPPPIRWAATGEVIDFDALPPLTVAEERQAAAGEADGAHAQAAVPPPRSE
jgi:hypothetical protein